MRLRNMIFAAALIACSCSAPVVESDEELFLSHEDICFVVGRKEMLNFNQDGIQTSFNTSKSIFRAGISTSLEDKSTGNKVDIVDKYYILALEGPLPSSGMVKGTIYLKTDMISTGYRSYESELEVKKMQGDKAWLWDDKQKIGLVITVR